MVAWLEAISRAESQATARELTDQALAHLTDLIRSYEQGGYLDIQERKGAIDIINGYGGLTETERPSAQKDAAPNTPGAKDGGMGQILDAAFVRKLGLEEVVSLRKAGRPGRDYGPVRVYQLSKEEEAVLAFADPGSTRDDFVEAVLKAEERLPARVVTAVKDYLAEMASGRAKDGGRQDRSQVSDVRNQIETPRARLYRLPDQPSPAWVSP